MKDKFLKIRKNIKKAKTKKALNLLRARNKGLYDEYNNPLYKDKYKSIAKREYVKNLKLIKKKAKN
ncbi:MAG: hypothetical protein ACOCV1_00060 [Bacillota bacterium]